MKCPYCDSNETSVVDSRQAEDGRAIRRRRLCNNCGKRFTTYEKAEYSIMLVVKRDGTRENFDLTKVINGIVRACQKRNVSMQEMKEMGARVERKVFSLGQGEVASSYIGELVMDELREVDQVAYIRFASVYRQFANVEKFAEEIDKLRHRNSQNGEGGANGPEDLEQLRAPGPGAGIIRVAVDGPSGAGKSTIAKRVAAKLGFDYIDTGAMYRAVGLKLTRLGIDPQRAGDDETELNKILDSTEIDFDENGHITLDGEDISASIRTPEVSKAASAAAKLAPVRAKLVEIQRGIGHRKSVVMDGRDIGTNVFPDAQYKFFLTAAAEERAQRRFLELREKGQDVTFEEILADVKARDDQDVHRQLNPLRRAQDAVLIDSTNMDIGETVGAIYSRVIG